MYICVRYMVLNYYVRMSIDPWPCAIRERLRVVRANFTGVLSGL